MTGTRQLAAILFADIEGFTLLMQDDEENARIVRDKFQSVLYHEVTAHNGRVAQFAGDGALCNFQSTIEAVRTAIAIQKRMIKEPVVPLRIGIHSGDVVIEDENIYGTGVNVASRIQSFAEPGGVFVSGKVYDEIKNQKDIHATSLGTYELKNVNDLMEIYAISNEGLIVPKRETLEGKGTLYKGGGVYEFKFASSMPVQIALADDHQLVRGGIKMLLENFPGFRVIIEASNGQELLDKISQSSLQLQIAMVDVTMPIMDGFETTRRLNELHPEIKVVALSVHDDVNTVNKMIESGANAYLLKDSSPQTVKETLLQVQEKGYYYDKLVIESLMKSKDSEVKKRSAGIDPVSTLTEREIEFIKRSCSEKTYKEIADDMVVSQRTVDGYRESVFSKLDVKSRTGLVLYAIHSGIVGSV